MKTLKLYTIFTAGIFLFLIATAYIAQKEYEEKKYVSFTNNDDDKNSNEKIIKFDHKLHVSDVGVKCEDCHTNVSASVSADENLNPKEETCGTCHDIKDQSNCNLCHYDNQYKSYPKKDSELIFSHKYHLTTEKMNCTDCHKDLDQVKYAHQSAGFMPAMETCYSCHNDQKASNNCESCHSNLTNLIPKNHQQTNFLNEHKLSFGISAKENCMMCHSDNFCQTCHSPLKYTGNNTKENFYAPYYTKENGTRTDRGKLQKLTTAHTLNYKFTHGLDADQKSFECKTCHDPVDFCASCHSNKGDLITGIVPKSHLQNNFVTLGVNTGGGLHSLLAKRDIESCQSCHDVEGRDPACIKCHYDNDGIKGTNPKTHESGFLRDEKGIWHDTQGAVCYTCHTDANARPNGISGIGFCGYCHGREKDHR